MFSSNQVIATVRTGFSVLVGYWLCTRICTAFGCRWALPSYTGRGNISAERAQRQLYVYSGC